MTKIADLLRKLAETPDDLTELPGIIEKIETLESSELELMDKVDKLHEANKRYLKMVTVAEPVEDPEPEPVKPPTLDELARMMAAEKE